MVRLRQAVLAAGDLDDAAGRLRGELGLGEPFADPGVGYFGLRNAVFALGDTFLEVVSPQREGTSAGRLIERRGGDCGYMLMFQVADASAARRRAAAAGVREVFALELDDMLEAHLHPADMRAAIVSVSEPRPPSAWRWGGPDWPARSARLELAGVRVAVADAEAVRARWRQVLGELPDGIVIEADRGEPGLVEIGLEAPGTASRELSFGGVRVMVRSAERHQEES